MNYQSDYHKGTLNPLQNYYSNCPVDSKSAQIKKYSSLYAESKVQIIFLLSNQTSRLRNLLLSLAILVMPLRKSSQPQLLMKIILTHIL